MLLQQLKVNSRVDKHLNRFVIFLIDVDVKIKVELPRAHRQWHAAFRIRQCYAKLYDLEFVNIAFYVQILSCVSWTLRCILMYSAWKFSVLQLSVSHLQMQ